jgi:hypothetical protein
MNIFKLLAVLLLSIGLALANDKDLLKVLSVKPGEQGLEQENMLKNLNLNLNNFRSFS